MIKTYKKIISSMALLLCFSMLLIGCSKETVSADKTAGILYDLFILSNSDGANEIGFTDEEAKELIEVRKSEIIRGMRTNFTTGGLPISDEDLERIYNAEIEGFKKLKYDVSIESEDKEKVVVKLSTTYVDIVKADMDAAKTTVSEAQESGKTSLDELSKSYVENIVKNFNSIEASSETKEELFEFTKENLEIDGKKREAWFPNDMEAFGMSLGKMVTGQ